MVYPSHFAKGEYGLKNPDRSPYEIVKYSIGDAAKNLKAVPTCKLRPWLQDFSLQSHYGAKELKAQIRAINELGIKEFLLWNAGCRYTESAFGPPVKS